MKIYRLKVNLPTFFAGAIGALQEDGNLYFWGYLDPERQEQERNRHWKNNVMMYHKNTIKEWGILNPENGWFEEVDEDDLEKVWPFDGCRYYYLSDTGVESAIWRDDHEDYDRKLFENIYWTEERAEKEWEKIGALAALKQLGVKAVSHEVNNMKPKEGFDALGKILISYPREYYTEVERYLKVLLGGDDEA